MQLRPVGIEGPGEELTPEGAESGERARPSAAGAGRRREGARGDGRHDESCFFPAASVARGAFWGADRQFRARVIKRRFQLSPFVFLLVNRWKTPVSPNPQFARTRGSLPA